MVIGLVALLLPAPLGSPAFTTGLLILVGPGGSVAMPVMTGLVLDSVPPERAGTASAIFNTFRRVGGAVAVAVVGALLATSATFISGMQISFAIAATTLLATALISLRIDPPPERPGFRCAGIDAARCRHHLVWWLPCVTCNRGPSVEVSNRVTDRWGLVRRSVRLRAAGLTPDLAPRHRADRRLAPVSLVAA